MGYDPFLGGFSQDPTLVVDEVVGLTFWSTRDPVARFVCVPERSQPPVIRTHSGRGLDGLSGIFRLDFPGSIKETLLLTGPCLGFGLLVYVLTSLRVVWGFLLFRVYRPLAIL